MGSPWHRGQGSDYGGVDLLSAWQCECSLNLQRTAKRKEQVGCALEVSVTGGSVQEFLD